LIVLDVVVEKEVSIVVRIAVEKFVGMVVQHCQI
jgi:hypothetical protein